MLAATPITPWHWIAFIVFVLVVITADLGIFHRVARQVSLKEALAWTAFWVLLAGLFAFGLSVYRDTEQALQFGTGYIVELSLSMDNVFVIALIFEYFRVPLLQQHRVLFWGILGALVMRGLMIGAGSALIAKFHWLLYAFGVFLVFTGFRMIFAREGGVEPEKNPTIRLARRFFPISEAFSGQKFSIRLHGRLALTPLALVLLMVETTDLVFAIDSLPAIFAVTQKPFIIFTSNVFAILGLRSLYFVLANAIGYFQYLKAGLSIILIFIGGKMLLPFFQDQFDLWDGFELTNETSLKIVAAIIAVSVVASLLAARLEKRRRAKIVGPN